MKDPYQVKYRTQDSINPEAVKRRMKKRKDEEDESNDTGQRPGLTNQRASGITTNETYDAQGNSRFSTMRKKR